MPRRPITGSPSFERTSPFLSASVISVFLALHSPVRTSEGRNFWNVSGKSMITQPAGLPPASFCASLSKFACSGFHAMSTPTLPPSFFHCATKSCRSAVPKASFRAPTFRVAPLPKAVTAACASTFPWRLSDGYVRQR